MSDRMHTYNMIKKKCYVSFVKSTTRCCHLGTSFEVDPGEHARWKATFLISFCHMYMYMYMYVCSPCLSRRSVSDVDAFGSD